jgi:hypothetical protein
VDASWASTGETTHGRKYTFAGGGAGHESGRLPDDPNPEPEAARYFQLATCSHGSAQSHYALLRAAKLRA